MDDESYDALVERLKELDAFTSALSLPIAEIVSRAPCFARMLKIPLASACTMFFVPFSCTVALETGPLTSVIFP